MYKAMLRSWEDGSALVVVLHQSSTQEYVDWCTLRSGECRCTGAPCWFFLFFFFPGFKGEIGTFLLSRLKRSGPSMTERIILFAISCVTWEK